MRQSNPEDTAHCPARLSWGAQNDPGVVTFDPLQKSCCEEKAQQSWAWFGPGPDVGVGVRSETFGFWAGHQEGAKTSLDKRPWNFWKTKGGSWEIIVVVRQPQK
jgi:hypothetical protein